MSRSKVKSGNYFGLDSDGLRREYGVSLQGIGKRTSLLWAGKFNIRDAIYEPVISSFNVFYDENRKSRVNAKIKEVEARGGFDGPKWRVEEIMESGKQKYSDKVRTWASNQKKLITFASPTSYFPHAVLRNDKDENGEFLPILAYPHPETINVLLRTKDNYFVIGNRLPLEKGGTSDQEGLCLIPSGFVDRNGMLPPSLETTLLKESEEIGFSNGYNFVKEYDPKKAQIIAAVTGSNTDSTKIIIYEIDVKSEDITTPKKLGEHGNLLFLPDNTSSIEQVISDGKYKGIVAPDHMLGGLAAYIDLKKEGVVD